MNRICFSAAALVTAIFVSTSSYAVTRYTESGTTAPLLKGIEPLYFPMSTNVANAQKMLRPSTRPQHQRPNRRRYNRPHMAGGAGRTSKKRIRKHSGTSPQRLGPAKGKNNNRTTTPLAQRGHKACGRLAKLKEPPCKLLTQSPTP